MTQIDQFNDQLNQKDNRFFRFRNDAIALDIAIFTEYKDIRHDERKNAINVLRKYRKRINVMESRDSKKSFEEFCYRLNF